MLHWSLVRLAHCLLVIALNDAYYFEQINMMMMMMIMSPLTLRSFKDVMPIIFSLSG